MTTQDKASAKDQVLARVRSKNPQTMELRFGCRIRYVCNGNVEYWYPSKDGKGRTQARDAYSEKRVQLHDHEKKWEEIIWRGEDVCSQLPEKWKSKWALVTRWSDGTIYVKYVILEILGSDMGLQELLIAFKVKDENGTMFNDEQINTLKIVSLFDLTKNLHQQSDEFYEAIFPLIPRA